MYRIKGPIQTMGPGVTAVLGARPGDVLAIDVSAGRSGGPGAGGARTGAAASREGTVMRVMAKITIPVESGSRAVNTGASAG
jgi:hypothetical protein